MKAADKLTGYDLVYIRWLDHNTHDGMWIETEDISIGPLVVETVGFLLDQDELSYQIISSVCETGGNEICRGFWYILKSDVVKMKKL